MDSHRYIRNVATRLKSGSRRAMRNGRFVKISAGSLVGLLGLAVVANAVTEGAVTDLGLSAVYGQTPWPSLHRDTRNSDFIPFVTPTRTRVKWTALDRKGFIPGAATPFPPSVGVDGSIYITSARGFGFSHMHALDPETGKVRWKTPRWFGFNNPFAFGGDTDLHIIRDDSALDHGAIAGTPTHDADGNVFLADQDQFWSWDSEGNVRWVTDILELGASFPWLSAVIHPTTGYIGGITADGVVMFFNRDDGSLAVPILELPGAAGPACPQGAWALIWAGGEVAFDIRRLVFCVAFGFDVEVANTPAIDPVTGRIFMNAAGATPEEAVLYAIDLVNDVDGPHWEIAWTALAGVGPSGASPTISFDGTQVFTTEGSGRTVSFDTQTGEPVFATAGGEPAFSPTTAPDGTIYAGSGCGLLALNPDGTTQYCVSPQAVAQSLLPELDPFSVTIPDIPGLGLGEITLSSDGVPIAALTSVSEVTPDRIVTGLSLGYRLNGTEPLLGRAIPLPHIDVLVAMDRKTGEVIPESVTIVPDGIEGFSIPSNDGLIALNQNALLHTLCTYVLSVFLPPEYRCPGLPKAGIVGVEAVSFREFSVQQIEIVREYIATVSPELPGGDVQRAFDLVRRGPEQLGAAVDSIDRARKEIKKRNAKRAKNHVLLAQREVDAARDLLDQEPDPSFEDQEEARALLESADTRLANALSELGP